MNQQDPIVIVSAQRTPIGQYLGMFSNVSASELGANVIKANLEQAHLPPEAIDEVIMGCVLSAGQGQAPARQAALKAGLPYSVGATTLNKMCGSGLKAIMLAHDMIQSGSANICIAGGMENMSRAPYLLAKARGGQRIGHDTLYDSMMLDGLEDAYDKGKPMGVFGEQCAQHYQFTRQAQDEFAIQSLSRSQTATHEKCFEDEISAIVVPGKSENLTINQDELPLKAKAEKIPQLKPVFSKDGTITPANASAISDGASTVLLMRESEALKRNLKPLAKICMHSSHAQAPDWFTTAPIGAISKLLKALNWQTNEVDLYEINEAFAVVTMAAIQELKLDIHKVNVHGGACALGHPIGASGARILTTLVHALKRYNKQRGIASLCIGGGEAVAIAIEMS